jgi:hypothetical protein
MLLHHANTVRELGNESLGASVVMRGKGYSVLGEAAEGAAVEAQPQRAIGLIDVSDGNAHKTIQMVAELSRAAKQLRLERIVSLRRRCRTWLVVH